MDARTRQLRPYQQECKSSVYGAWQAGYRNVLAVMPTGAGKCLGKGTPILMYDGTIKAVEDVKVGEFLMGPDSAPRLVLSTCTGREMLYRVTPIKGDSYVVNESHILSLKITEGLRGTTSAAGRSCKPGEVVNLSVTEYMQASKTFKHVAKGWRAPVDFALREESFFITPYILGVWLGDGTSRRPEISNVDSEVLDEWASYAGSIKHDISVHAGTNRIDTHAIVTRETTGRGIHSNKLLNELHRLNLVSNKHVPHEYKTASLNSRLEVLAGIIDTDGYLTKGYYDIVVKQQSLAEDIAFIARSVGLAAYYSLCRKTCTNTGTTGDYFRITISGDIDKIPCRVNRRKAEPRKQKKSVLVTGISVEAIGEGDYFGFTITGDHLFMLGDFTVTHNTVTFSDIIHDHRGASCAIAHRQELVGQISLAIAREGVLHKIIGPSDLVASINQIHMEELGRSFVDPRAQCAVAGVDTLISWSKPTSKKRDGLLRWAAQVTLVVQDEVHHLLDENKWGKALKLFPNAFLLGVTATPERADGKGLGRGVLTPKGTWTNDGVLDHMIVGPSMRELINAGYLTDYRVFCPPSNLDLSTVNTGVDGDYIRAQLALKTKESTVLGDVVTHYLKHAYGKLGVTFVPDVETAGEMSRRFNEAGVPAEVVTAKTPGRVRREILRRFARRELLQLVNVDLFGEGFDLPAIECVSMARATASYALYVQQFGRALRLMAGKERAIILDHVGNVLKHGLPDKRDPRTWTLERRDRRSKKEADDTIPMRNCTGGVHYLSGEPMEGCFQPYEAYYAACPYCGCRKIPQARSSVEFVDGDLFELDPETMSVMMAEKAKVDRHVDDVVMGMHGMSAVVVNTVAKNHREKQAAQDVLRQWIGWWAAWQTQTFLRSEAECQKRFYWKFHVDVLSAQALGKADAEDLARRIAADVTELEAEYRRLAA